MLSCCEDHSMRLWDYQTCEAKIILTGHRDNVSGAAFINENVVVSSSWDLRVMVWKFWISKQALWNMILKWLW